MLYMQKSKLSHLALQCSSFSCAPCPCTGKVWHHKAPGWQRIVWWQKFRKKKKAISIQK